MDPKEEYERKLCDLYTYRRAMSSLGFEIFSASPVRIREQKEIMYFEIGASNITDNGAIIVNKVDKMKLFANETSFKRQHLRVGDVVVAFRSKPKFGAILLAPDKPLVANTSMIIIRTNSNTTAANLCTYLNRPDTSNYLEYLISMEDREILTIDILKELLIPNFKYYDSNNALHTMLEIFNSYKNIEKLSQSLLSQSTAILKSQIK